jgi:hypothetical protein
MPRRALPLLAALVLAGCASSNKTPADVTPDPASSTATQGRFALTFTIDRATDRPGDAITGKATLALLSPGGATISGSSGPIEFGFAEVGGSERRLEPAWPADCAPLRVTSNVPIIGSITKSGTVVDGPNADWARQFLQDPDVHLPAGEWDITANAKFFDSQGCSGQAIDLVATVRVHVTE